MKRIKGDLYRCDHCDITEKRTSQQHSLLSLGSESTLISGGNRAGKTEVGACLSVAFASGSNEQYVKDWLQLNNLPLDLVPENPSTVWCASLSYKDGLEYLRPKLDKYLPITIIWHLKNTLLSLLIAIHMYLTLINIMVLLKSKRSDRMLIRC